MVHINKLVLAIVLVALSSCQRSTFSPSLLDCYQSGSLSFKLDKDRIFIDRTVSSEFSLNKRKVGWVISSYLLLVKKETGAYGFVKTEDGPYDWAIPDPSIDIVKVVSQDGVPFYFGKCLITQQES